MAISPSEKQLPWYKRTRRWGQTNLTEMDPVHCDLNFWKDYWKRTRVQGVIVNAGGIVAYYPSALGLQYRAKGLGKKKFLRRIYRRSQGSRAVCCRTNGYQPGNGGFL